MHDKPTDTNNFLPNDVCLPCLSNREYINTGVHISVLLSSAATIGFLSISLLLIFLSSIGSKEEFKADSAKTSLGLLGTSVGAAIATGLLLFFGTKRKIPEVDETDKLLPSSVPSTPSYNV